MNFSKEQKDYIIHVLEHCEVLTGGKSSGKTLKLIKQQEEEIERLNSIIKEVREYIEEHQCCGGKINVMTLTEYKELLQMLDKENK